MAGSTDAPYGMIQVGVLGQGYNTGGQTMYALNTNNTNAIYAGQPVAIASGAVVAIAATPTTTYSTSTPVGVASGFRYIDGTTGQLTFANSLVASSMTAAGHSSVQVYVWDNPKAIFKIQADAAMAATDVNLNSALVNITANNSLNGQSKMRVDADAATTATLAVRVLGLFETPNNAWTSTYPDILVTWNPGVHAYELATLA